MRFFVGTSGYGYKEWKGPFYPQKLPQREMLHYYGERFPAVEINNTAYQMPRASVFESWTGQVPEDFRFVLKAPMTITHFKRLKNAAGATKDFLRAASVLKKRLGPLLFQLPPNFKKDIPRLENFLRLFDKKTRVAFEFRHESWLERDVFDCLRTHSCALCIVDTDELPCADIVRTTNWGYVRLRRQSYAAKRLAEWVAKLKRQRWKEAYVFFKHEDSGTGPKLAKRFLDLVDG